MADRNRILVPPLLSFTAGYVDTAGFLSLQGLFTAHVTGNFVTFGASLALGTSGALAKLLALPVFCVVVVAVRVVGTLLSKHRRPVFEILLGFKIVLLIAGAALAIRLGPFHDGDSPPAVLTGMVFVSAMAIQNAVHRIYPGSAPPSTLMTGTTTQIMIDLARYHCSRRRWTPGRSSIRQNGAERPAVRRWMRRGCPSLHALQNVVLCAAADCKHSRACNSLCRPRGQFQAHLSRRRASVPGLGERTSSTILRRRSWQQSLYRYGNRSGAAATPIR
jgi:uncharacterized membrane protein YoaK (UPF0700 family)